MGDGTTIPIAEFRALPMPPSVNAAYAHARVHGVMRRVPSAKLRSFEREFKRWAMVAYSALGEQRNVVRGWRGKPLAVEFLFYFPRDAVWTKDRRPKKLDVDNRIKPLADALAEFLGVDDSWNFKVTAHKLEAPGTGGYAVARYSVI